jgi:hypothetical protein
MSFDPLVPKKRRIRKRFRAEKKEHSRVIDRSLSEHYPHPVEQKDRP